jgi:hypothetical protein
MIGPKPNLQFWPDAREEDMHRTGWTQAEGGGYGFDPMSLKRGSEGGGYGAAFPATKPI